MLLLLLKRGASTTSSPGANDSAIPLSTISLAKLDPAATTTENHFSAITTAAVSVAKFDVGATTTSSARDTSAIPLALIRLAKLDPGATTTEKHFSAITQSAIVLAKLDIGATTTERHYSALELKALSVSAIAVGATTTTGASNDTSLPIALIGITGSAISATRTGEDVQERPRKSNDGGGFQPKWNRKEQEQEPKTEFKVRSETQEPESISIPSLKELIPKATTKLSDVSVVLPPVPIPLEIEEIRKQQELEQVKAEEARALAEFEEKLAQEQINNFLTQQEFEAESILKPLFLKQQQEEFFEAEREREENIKRGIEEEEEYALMYLLLDQD